MTQKNVLVHVYPLTFGNHLLRTLVNYNKLGWKKQNKTSWIFKTIAQPSNIFIVVHVMSLCFNGNNILHDQDKSGNITLMIKNEKIFKNIYNIPDQKKTWNFFFPLVNIETWSHVQKISSFSHKSLISKLKFCKSLFCLYFQTSSLHWQE